VPLRGAPGRLILVGVPWVTSWFPSILFGYNMESLSEVDYLVLYTKLSSRLILVDVTWVTSWFPFILFGYNIESLSELDYLVLYTKLSSRLWAHKSGRAGSTDRSAGPLVGRVRLLGTAETLVGGDPWVPMSNNEHLLQ
jgi:hypothetical protein